MPLIVGHLALKIGRSILSLISLRAMKPFKHLQRLRLYLVYHCNYPETPFRLLGALCLASDLAAICSCRLGSKALSLLRSAKFSVSMDLVRYQIAHVSCLTLTGSLVGEYFLSRSSFVHSRNREAHAPWCTRYCSQPPSAAEWSHRA